MLGLAGWLGVVAGLAADVEGLGGGARHGYVDAVKAEAGHLVVGIVSDEVLRAQVFADSCKGFVEVAGLDVEALAAGLFGERDERVLAADVAAGAGLDGHVDDGVDHDFGAECLLQRFGIRVAVHGVAAIGDDDEDLAALLGSEGLRAEVDGIIERRGLAASYGVEAVVQLADLVGEADEFADVGGEFDEAHLVPRTQQRVNEAFGGFLLERAVLHGAGAGVDGQG